VKDFARIAASSPLLTENNTVIPIEATLQNIKKPIASGG
jgi:hypothetical protein